MWTVEKQREATRKSYFKRKENNPEQYEEKRERERVALRKKRKENQELYAFELEKWKKQNPDKAKEIGRKSHKKWVSVNHNKQRVERLFRRYLKRNNIGRPKECEWCGSGKKIESHHPDYSKPFDVVWLCHKCHCTTYHKVQPGRPPKDEV